MEKIQKAEIKDKKILVRGDVDVEIRDNKVVDDYRLKALMPTLKYLIQRQPEKIIIVGHMGRPRIKAQEELEDVRGNNNELILKPVANRFKQLLGFSQPVEEQKIDDIPAYWVSKDIYLLENIRFDWRETQNDDSLAKSLSKMANIFVFDAFASSHRSHASSKGVQKFMPSYLGLNCQKEIKTLSQIKNDPQRPFVVLIGGTKIADKQPVIVNLASISDKVLVGGKIANSLYEAKFSIQEKSDVKSLIEELESKELVKKRDDTIEEIETSGVIKLPIDGKHQEGDIIDLGQVRQGTSHLIPEIRDIGPDTIDRYAAEIRKAKTVFWAGPMGMFEREEFSQGTKQLMEVLKDCDCKAYAAGGDTHRAIKKFQHLSEFDFISTGGGAALDFLAGKTLAVFKSHMFEK
jgi:3-phosphoglycerate kinase